jgi:SAM-dependent methyltransferase
MEMTTAMLSLQQMVDQDLFTCPRCSSRVRPDRGQWRCTGTHCVYASQPFPVVSGVPAIVDFENSVLDADQLRTTEGASEVKRSGITSMLRRAIHPANHTAPTRVATMLTMLRADGAGAGRRPRILVIGGGTVGDGLGEVYADPTVDLVSFDIYSSSAVQFVGDGHAIPLSDGSIDGVVIQAVLEHVLEPTVVAAEIERVLRPGGMVYADTPFLQQVHEGPYDFTRFTDSGHRYLFRRFERIDSGAVAGAGTALLWSIDYFVRALTRSVRMGRIVALCLCWLSRLDRVLDPKYSVDAASSVFFLGRKTEREISRSDIIDYYQGGMYVRSTS